MELIFLTKSSVPIIGQVAFVLGMIMDALFRFTSQFGITNIGLSIILFTIITNLLMWPLTVSQQKSSKLMSVMQPELQAVQKKYKGKTDQASMARMQAETRAVYQKYGTSMSGSCLFLLIQMPILFGLYQVIYKIPAYVPSVYKVFESVASPLMQQSNFVSTLTELAPKVKPPLTDAATVQNVIDLLYKFTPAQWSNLEQAYPALSSTISAASAEIAKMNYFLGVNLATPPFQGIDHPNFAWIIPVLSAAVQWYSAKLMTAGTKNNKAKVDEDNMMAQQMQSMNTMMPIMSLFFCFTLPAGIGIYWVASGLCRMIQQLVINAQLDKMDVDEIVRKNTEKANEKAIREGKNPALVKSNSDKLLREVKRQEEAEKNEEERQRQRTEKTVKQVEESTAYYQKNAKLGSLASKANMVAMYDERLAEKRRNKKDKGSDISSGENSNEN